jgi:predicted PurR-regulated permease PerM
MATFYGTGVFVILLLILFLIGFAAHAISTQIYKRLKKTGNPYPRTWRVATFIGSFLVILGTLFWILITNLRIER